MRPHCFEKVKERVRPGVDSVSLRCVRCGRNIYLYSEEWVRDKATGRLTTRRYGVVSQRKVDNALQRAFEQPCVTVADLIHKEKYKKAERT